MHPEEARKLFFKEVDNCYWNPKLSIKVAPNGDRTVVTSAALQKNEPLVVLNKNAFFNAEKCIEHSKEDISSIRKTLIIPAYLYQFYTNHGATALDGYAYYFNALPTYEWYEQNHEVFKIYLKLTGKQRKELHDNFYVFEQIDSFIEWASQIPGHTVDKEQAIRSVLASLTRTWSSVGLVPWIDFCNHSYEGSFLQSEGTTIVASHAYSKDEEVNVTYGVKDSLQLLSVYGYAAKDKTVGIKFPPISSFALAVDSGLQKYADSSVSAPCLLGKQLRNFDFLLSHMRLCVFDKVDALTCSDPEEACQTFLNAQNELKALKLFLHMVQVTQKNLEELKNKTEKALGKIPEVLEEDFKGKDEVFNNITKRIYKHWLDLLS
jgi:hypothetical protein